MKHFIVYDPATGTVLRAGTCQDSDLAVQAGAGEAVMEATANAITVAEVNLDPVRDTLYAKIDAEAEAFCLRFMTPGSTQAMRYMEKRFEAEKWETGVSNPAHFPFLAAEAAATGVTIDALVAIVLAKSLEWRMLGAGTEGLRLGAKKAVLEATNVAEMHAASQINWESLLA